MKPNILHICTDQLSAKWLESAINAGILPNLQKIEQNGVSFSQAFVDNPVCMPSRISTITGRTCVTHKTWVNNQRPFDAISLPTFPQILQDNGYRTGGFGKFHLESTWDSFHHGAGKFGFHESAVTDDGRFGNWLDWIREKHPEHYEQALSTVWHWHIPRYDREYNTAKFVREIRNAEEKHMIPWRNKYGIGPYAAWPEFLPYEITQTKWTGDRACEFISRQRSGQPFYAYCSFVAPHTPSVPTPDHLARVKLDCVPEPLASESVEGLPSAMANSLIEKKLYLAKLSPAQWREVRRYYFAYLAMVDDSIGDLMHQLSVSGLEESTHIIFTSDHGDMLGDYGMWDKLSWHYDACIRVPLIISGPGITRGKTSEVLAGNLDIAPTVLEMAGIATSALQADGRSLLPCLQGEPCPDDWRKEVFVESYASSDLMSSTCNGPDTWAFTLRSPERRYTWYPYGNAEQLFDLRSDPCEKFNLAGCSDKQGLVGEYKSRLVEKVQWLNLRDCIRTDGASMCKELLPK